MNPGIVFLQLWQTASNWTPTERAEALPNPAKRGLIEALLDYDDGTQAANGLTRHLEAAWAAGDPEYSGLVLAVMKAIDARFYAIHPRIGLVPVAAAARPPMTDWLEAAAAERVMTGAFARSGELMLIARGPLYRPAADPASQYAESIRDRFMALSVVDTSSREDTRPISIDLRVIGQSPARGVKSPKTPGRETVAFLPVAKTDGDLERVSTVRGAEHFVSVAPSATFDAGAKLHAAALAAGSVDIAIAPEFVIPTSASETFSAAMSKASGAAPKLIIAGSGNTEPDSNGKVWNEARGYNDFGHELWRQRKIWPAGLSKDRAADFKLGGVGTTDLVYEDTGSANTVSVVDIEGVGRSVILICQDLKAQPIALDLARQYEPDWIFVPILDAGASIGRWMHTEAYELSRRTQARFVIASSISMCFWGSSAPASLPAVGIAIGPAQPAPPTTDTSRAVLEAYLVRPGDDFVTIQWGVGAWQKTKVGAEPA